MRIPHMGWNQLERVRESTLLRDTGDKPYVYFAHSYYAPVVPATAATCDYTCPTRRCSNRTTSAACSFIRRSRATVGLQIVRNFVES